MIKNIIFDIDGTLLRVKKAEFKARFLELLRESESINRLGGADVFLNEFHAIHHGTGEKTNRQVLFSGLSARTGLDKEFVEKKLDYFYTYDFPGMRTVFGPPCEELLRAVGILKDKGYRLLIATGPVFPICALVMRLNAAGFDENDFSYISCDGNSSFFKNTPAFYTEFCMNAGVIPTECMMVGNSAAEDMIAAQVGMECFFLTGFEEGIPDENCRKGDPAEFLLLAESLPPIKEI